tara:strand:+ start:878 stop:1093 length:216 start_codon:yes stop_codon:yes gene_type:complete
VVVNMKKCYCCNRAEPLLREDEFIEVTLLIEDDKSDNILDWDEIKIDLCPLCYSHSDELEVEGVLLKNKEE